MIVTTFLFTKIKWLVIFISAWLEDIKNFNHRRKPKKKLPRWRSSRATVQMNRKKLPRKLWFISVPFARCFSILLQKYNWSWYFLSEFCWRKCCIFSGPNARPKNLQAAFRKQAPKERAAGRPEEFVREIGRTLPPLSDHSRGKLGKIESVSWFDETETVI